MLGLHKANSPLVVEVVSNADWWQPYIPPLVGLVGSIIVAGVAIFSIRKSTNTSEKAITSADIREREKWKIDSDREREKWHRDNLLRVCSEALRVSREISHHYNEAGGACLKYSDLAHAQDVFRLHMDEAQAAIGKVAPLSYDMMLLGEFGLSTEFQEVRQVGEYVAPAFLQFHRYLVANFYRLRQPTESILMAEAMRAELHASLEWRRYWKAGQHLSHTTVAFQYAAQKAISPQSLPDNAPARIDGPVFTPEEHPDLFYPPPGASQNPFRRLSPLDWNAGDTADPEPTSGA